MKDKPVQRMEDKPVMRPSSQPLPAPEVCPAGVAWLKKHADYQRVYREGRRQSLPLMTYFFRRRGEEPGVPGTLGTRVGLTAGRVLGKAVERNRIKRRMRAAVRRYVAELSAPVDLVLHPRRAVLEAPFAEIERDVARAIRAAGRVGSSTQS